MPIVDLLVHSYRENMYIPAQFAISDRAEIFAFIKPMPLASLSRR